MDDTDSELVTVVLWTGELAVAFNDHVDKRDNLRVAISTDNGHTWIRVATIETSDDNRDSRRSGLYLHYPSLVQVLRCSSIKHECIVLQHLIILHSDTHNKNGVNQNLFNDMASPVLFFKWWIILWPRVWLFKVLSCAYRMVASCMWCIQDITPREYWSRAMTHLDGLKASGLQPLIWSPSCQGSQAS